MFLTVGMTLGIRVPVVGPLKDINFQKHSGAPLAVLVYIYIYIIDLILYIQRLDDLDALQLAD